MATPKDILINKHTRSYVFLIITVIVIFAINALLPTIEGKAHYTADAVTVTYKEYLEMKDQDEHYSLTWRSEEDIREYRHEYKELHPEIYINAILPPDTFEVQVYTRYFFNHPFWYITTITRVVSAVLLFYAVFNVLLTKHKDTYTRYIELDNELKILVDNSLDPSTFEPWMVNEFNCSRKRTQHIDNVKYALNKLERHTSYKIRVLAKINPEDPVCEPYLNKKQELLDQLEESYLSDVVPHKPVRNFKFIQPTFVTCGVNKLGHTTDSYSLIESDSVHLGKNAVRKILLTTMLTIMFASLLTITVVTAADKPWYWIVIDILTTVTPLIIQIPMAFDYCNSYMEEHLITNLLARRSIAFLYLAHMQKGHEHEETNITRN